MALPEPKPGLVIRYDYVWRRQAMAGREQGKTRPACLVATSDDTPRPRFVVILPITHSPPTDTDVGIEIPQRVRQALGLDDEPCWVIVSEYNIDAWPNAGLQPLPGRPRSFSHGFLPPKLFAEVKGTFLDLARSGRNAGVNR